MDSLKPWLDKELYNYVKKHNPELVGLPSIEEEKSELLKDEGFQDIIRSLREEGQRAKAKRLSKPKQNKNFRNLVESGETIILE